MEASRPRAIARPARPAPSACAASAHPAQSADRCPPAPAIRRARLVPMFGALVLAAGLGACASVPPPTAQLAVARSSIDQASAQPITDPEGAAALARARDEIAAANRALDKEDNVTARRMAELADADARLAMASARAASSRQAVADVQKSLDALRTEINRGSSAAQ